MEISSVINQTVADTEVKKSNGDLGKDEFLKILAAQLQFQDPMEGGDNSAYVAQLAQFSSLEQMENLNVSLNELKGNQNLLYGTVLIGKMVNLAFEDQMVSGVVDKVKLVDSMLKVIVGGKEYDAKSVISLEEEEVEVAPVVSGEEVIE
ncbi:MAG: flagellar hook capping FlgD N-terminal domain-containing protein [Bacillota bacterium]|nr:flagellar hook capping FlgD N-terminal domain-containing protein [Bacillota bacterium]